MNTSDADIRRRVFPEIVVVPAPVQSPPPQPPPPDREDRGPGAAEEAAQPAVAVQVEPEGEIAVASPGRREREDAQFRVHIDEIERVIHENQNQAPPVQPAPAPARGRGRGRANPRADRGRGRGQGRRRDPGGEVLRGFARAFAELGGARDAARENARDRNGDREPGPVNAQDSIHGVTPGSEPIQIRAVTRAHQKSIFVLPLVLTLLVCCLADRLWTRITLSLALVVFSLLVERAVCAAFLFFGLDQYKAPPPAPAMMPLAAFISEAVAQPVQPVTRNVWRRIWLWTDLMLQSFCVDFGMRSYMVTGYVHHVSDHLEAVHLHDVRLAYQRPVNLEPDRLWITASFVDSYHDNSRIRIVWCQEHARTVQINLLTLTPQERHVQSFEHTRRITNVLVNGAVCFDVMFGSQWVALIRCARADVVGQHAAASMGLNWNGAAGLGCSALAIAPQMAWGSLLSVITVLAFACIQTLIQQGDAFLSRSA